MMAVCGWWHDAWWLCAWEMAVAAMRIETSGWPHDATKHMMGEWSEEIFFLIEIRRQRAAAC
jgi:hypothetical protein